MPEPADSRVIQVSAAAKVYIAGTLLLGMGAFAYAGMIWPRADPYRFAFYLAVAGFAAGLKVRLPGSVATLSVTFFFQLLAAVELGFSQAVAVSILGGLIQTCWRPKLRPQPIQVIFSCNVLAISAGAAALAFDSSFIHLLGLEFTARVALATTALFLTNNLLIAGIVCLTQGNPLRDTLKSFAWYFPHYLAAAIVVALFHALSHVAGWQTALLSLPAVYVIYRAYQGQIERVEAHSQHVEQMAALHIRTIESLALAIECKDATTHEHLGRVQVYALEVGRKLGLGETDIEAIRAASLLHDIGKLAVPEHIINKPGRLTPEEFEKMKIHPVVGAEILETVQFPYPVVPIVRSHHEKWDGLGYPDGLKGEEIPIGARVISAVDCLDALASDRQYRRALPLEQAMDVVRKESGKAFDPRIVEILDRHYVEFEQKAKAQTQHGESKLSLDLKVERGLAPAAGFESSEAPPPPPLTASVKADFAAQQEDLWALLERIQEVGPALRLDETLALAAMRLRTIVPHACFAAYVLRERVLHPLYVTGEEEKYFSSLQIPVGQGLSGWVAENRKPIVNGNPSVEAGYLSDPTKFSKLRSAASVPIESGGHLTGVLTLYAAPKDAFTQGHIRGLQAIAARLGVVIEKGAAAPASDTPGCDQLTGLPNARHLFLHLQQEVARCREEGLPLSVLMGDLDRFRSVNSQFGKSAGDRLLQTLAENLRAACGEDGYIARMAGDDFAVVLPGISAQAASARVPALQQAVREAGLTVFGADLVSLSVGVSNTQESQLDGDTLLDDAARDLMRAKRDGVMHLQSRG